MSATNIKCVFIGSKGVGKTAIITSFLNSRFEGWISSEFSECVTDFELWGQKYVLHLFDMAQQSADEGRRRTYLGSDVFVICFSVIDPDSYDDVRSEWHPGVRKHWPHAPIVLVGTHVDCRNNLDALRSGTSPVTPEEGSNLAEEIGAVIYKECNVLMASDSDSVLIEAFLSTQGFRNRNEYSSLLQPLVSDSTADQRAPSSGGLFSHHLRTFKLATTSSIEIVGFDDRSQMPTPGTSRRGSLANMDQESEDCAMASDEKNNQPVEQEVSCTCRSAPQIDADAYTVTSPQGLCLVINIEKYDDRAYQDRTGSQRDIQRIQHVFGNLDFDVTIHEDLNCNEIVRLLTEVAFDQVKPEHGCFVCFIMAHGAQGSIFGRDGVRLEIQSIVDKFRPNHCPALQHRPKLFFIQACRGIHTDIRRTFSDSQEGAVWSNQYCPQDSDLLLRYANTEGYMAMRDEQSGSPYIQTLCDAIQCNHKTEHIFDIMTKVNCHFKQVPISSEWGSCHMVPQMVSQLSKKCYLDPGRVQ